MDEHHETPRTYLSERMDSASTFTTTTRDPLDSDLLNSSIYGPTKPQSHMDTLATATLNSAVPTCAPSESTILLYDSDTSTRILTMATTENKERSLPLLQRIQLTGPKDY